MTLDDYRRSLFIYKHRLDLLYLLENHRVLVVYGPKGSGKSTQIPQYILEAGWSTSKLQILSVFSFPLLSIAPSASFAFNSSSSDCLIMNTFTKIKEELGFPLNQLLAISQSMTIPNHQSSISISNSNHQNHSRIKFTSLDLMLWEIMSDPLLVKYSVIIINDANNHTLLSDTLLLLLKRILKIRLDLKVIITCSTVIAATIQRFVDYFGKGENHSTVASLSLFNPHPFNMEINASPLMADIHHLDHHSTDNTIDAVISTILQIYHPSLLSSPSPSPLEESKIKEMNQKSAIEMENKIKNIKINGDILIFLPNKLYMEILLYKLEKTRLEFHSISIKDKEDVELLISRSREREILSKDYKIHKDQSNDYRKIILIVANVMNSRIIPNNLLSLQKVKHVIDLGIMKQEGMMVNIFDQDMEYIRNDQIVSCDKMDSMERIVTGILNSSLLSSNDNINSIDSISLKMNAIKIYRLYTKNDYNEMKNHKRMNDSKGRNYNFIMEMMEYSRLASLILQLKFMCIDNIGKCDWIISPPPMEAISMSLETLYSLNAIDEMGRITDSIGMIMLESPINNPILSKMLIMAMELDCIYEVSMIVAMIICCMELPTFMPMINSHDEGNGKRLNKSEDENEERGYSRKREKKCKYSVEEGDYITLMNIFNDYYFLFYQYKHGNYRSHNIPNPRGWCEKNNLLSIPLSRAIEIRNEILKFSGGKFKREEMKNIPLPLEGNIKKERIKNIQKCISCGLIRNIARADYVNSCYRNIRKLSRDNGESQPLFIHPQSVLFNRMPKYVVYWDIIESSFNSNSIFNYSFTKFDENERGNRKGKMFMRGVMGMEEIEWLTEIIPNIYNFKM